VTPQLLTILGMSLSASERAYCEVLVNKFSGVFFIIWVIIPTLAGFACRRLLTPSRVAPARHWLILASAAALLLLNYINSAIAWPHVQDSPASVIVVTIAIAVALSAVGLFTGWLMANVMRLPAETRTALLFSLSMKHTGLALVFAGSVLANEPYAILIIVLAALTQHLNAGIVQWFLQRRAAL
jgi:predicted Na+-dependent transporter